MAAVPRLSSTQPKALDLNGADNSAAASSSATALADTLLCLSMARPTGALEVPGVRVWAAVAAERVLEARAEAEEEQVCGEEVRARGKSSIANRAVLEACGVAFSGMRDEEARPVSGICGDEVLLRESGGKESSAGLRWLCWCRWAGPW